MQTYISGMNNVFEFLNGRFVTIDGVAGRLRHEVFVDWLGLTVERLMHDATPAGRRSNSYREIRRRLGDDYSTDLTQNLERYCALTARLGFAWKEA